MFKTIYQDFFSFLKKPNDRQIKLSLNHKLKFLLILFSFELLISFIIILPLNLGINELVPLRTDKFDYADTFLRSLLLWVIVVPFIEELIFRYILRYQGAKKKIINKNLWNYIFPVLVYILSMGFGFAHLSNYLNESKLFLILSPFIIFSQLIGGLIITYIRVRINFIWGVFYHWLWNFLFVIIIPFLESEFTKPYVEETNKFKISIIEKPFFETDKSQVLKIDSSNKKIHKINLNQYSMQTLLDTIYMKDRYYVDDVLINLEYTSKDGLTKEQFLNILRKNYEIK